MKREEDEPPKLDYAGATPFQSTSAQSSMKDSKSDDNDEDASLRFGLVGRSGLGKSTFINTMLSYTEDDPKKAKTGASGNTTKRTHAYVHPKIPKITMVDMPGFGTIQMDKDKFCEELQQMKTLDYFFIFMDTCLMADDVWVAKKITEAGIPFSFIRTKIDRDIEEGKQFGKSGHQSVEYLRRKINGELKSVESFKDVNVYLVSNLKSMWLFGDWNALLQDIAGKLPQVKVYTLMFFIPVLNPDVIEAKHKTLKDEIPSVARWAVVPTMMTIAMPEYEISLNTGVILKKISEYREAFGLEEEFSKDFDKDIEFDIHNRVKKNLKKEFDGTSRIPLWRQYKFLSKTITAVDAILTEELLLRKNTALELYKTVNSCSK